MDNFFQKTISIGQKKGPPIEDPLLNSILNPNDNPPEKDNYTSNYGRHKHRQYD